MRLNVFNSLMGLCVATAAVSCSDGLVEDNLRPTVGESDMISFVVADQNNATRGGSYGNRPCGGAILRSANGADSLYLNMSVADITDDLSTRASQITDAAELSRLNMTCVIRTINDVYTSYFENVAFNKNGSVWSSDTPYYWLENETHYKFYGYYTPGTPEDSGVEFIPGTSENKFAPSIKYTVNEDVDKQFDLSYSAPSTTENGLEYEYISSSATNPAVGLSIKHALSKIAFRTGDGMAAGTIQSITITNVYNKGELNLVDGTWKVSNEDEDKEDFTLSNINYDTATSTDGDIKTAEGVEYFMLLPESFTDDSEIEVVFQPQNGEKATYSAPLRNLPAWQAGKSYTYTITIDPEKPKSELEIIIDPEYKTVDAHYVIAKATVYNPKNVDWKLKVEIEDQNIGELKPSIVKATNDTYKKFVDFYEEGYWLDTEKDKPNNSARGTETETGGPDDTDGTVLYIFIPENVSDKDRNINIKLLVEAGKYETLENIVQKCPEWNGDFGVECIEDGLYAWGFNWEDIDSEIIKFQMPQNDDESDHDRFHKVYQTNNDFYPYIKNSGNQKTGNWEVTVNLDKYTGSLSLNMSDDNGLKNTWDLYNFNGMSGLITIINEILSLGGIPDKNLGEIIDQAATAARACALKNRFEVEIVTAGSVSGYKPILENDDLKWFLPAKNEAELVNGALSGFYWTSTDDSESTTQSYKFQLGGILEKEDRTTRLPVRACRKRD